MQPREPDERWAVSRWEGREAGAGPLGLQRGWWAVDALAGGAEEKEIQSQHVGLPETWVERLQL